MGIWLVGGFSSSISDMAWHPGPPENDQSGSAFRQAGLLMMYPSLRGGNENPGVLERFYGEVDDVVAAAEYAAKQDYVDPERIYLGGHSTGGTLALLVAESHSRFRAVFAFGPVDDVLGYGSRMLPFDTTDPREAELRSPLPWLSGIQIPTFVFEGTQKSNVQSLRLLAQAPHPAQVTFHELRGATHFSTLAPMTRLIAAKIGQDTGAAPNLRFTEEELALALRHAGTE
jgi:acetyl esterase/lipase